MSTTAQASPSTVLWSEATSKALTSSTPVVSDAMDVSFVKFLTIYPVYTAGSGTSGNTLNYYVELSPADTGNVWNKYGIYVNSSGTWTMQPALYASTAGTASTALRCTPLTLENLAAKRIRFGATETGSGNAGTVAFTVVKNTVN